MDRIMAPPNNIVPSWLQQEMDYEKYHAPKKLLQNEGRMAVWSMCSFLGVCSNGIPGQACRLFERYLAARFRSAGPLLQSAEGKRRFKEELSAQVLVAMATCIQLSSKSACATIALNSKYTQICLAHQGINTTVSEINHMEFLVFKALDYQIPLFTSVDIAQLLAAEIGVPMFAMKDIGLLTDLAEYRRDKVDTVVKQVFKTPSADFNPAIVSTLHLAAGTVAAVSRCLPACNATLESRLADLTKAPVTYIECIITVILTYVLPIPKTSHEDVCPIKKQKLG